MTPAAEASADQRTHVFTSGIRFDTHLEFRTSGVLGRRLWRALPAPETSAEGSGWVALMQARSLLLGRLPAQQEIKRVSLRDQLALVPGDFLVRLPVIANDLSVRWRPGCEGLQPAHQASQTLACLSDADGLRWALVVGWELAKEPGADGAQTSALLLLDSRLAGPWATGYNARMHPVKRRWLGLDGETLDCELLGLMELRAR